MKVEDWLKSIEKKLEIAQYTDEEKVLFAAKEGQIHGLWVTKDVPRMDMVHHQNMTVELITCLLAA
jgi:hypothetical protein